MSVRFTVSYDIPPDAKPHGVQAVIFDTQPPPGVSSTLFWTTSQQTAQRAAALLNRLHPHITTAHAHEWQDETDQAAWIEYHLLDPHNEPRTKDALLTLEIYLAHLLLEECPDGTPLVTA